MLKARTARVAWTRVVREVISVIISMTVVVVVSGSGIVVVPVMVMLMEVTRVLRGA